MKLKVLALALIVALASWAQTTSPAPNTAPDNKPTCACCDKAAADACPCCQAAKDGKAGACCGDMKTGGHKHGKMACCKGASCPRASKDGNAAGCCGKQCPMAANGHKGCCPACKGGASEGK